MATLLGDAFGDVTVRRVATTPAREEARRTGAQRYLGHCNLHGQEEHYTVDDACVRCISKESERLNGWGSERSPIFGVYGKVPRRVAARPNVNCPVCGTVKPHTVCHHDHFADLVREIATQKHLLVFDDMPVETFPETIICNDCNHLCGPFKRKHKNTAEFMSLSPDDMRAVLAGNDVLDQVLDRYREPFRYWANRLDAWPEFKVAALRRPKPFDPSTDRTKPERKKVFKALEDNAALKDAFDRRDVEACHRIARKHLGTGEWDHGAMWSFAMLLWFKTHEAPTNASVFSKAFVENRIHDAAKTFSRGLRY